MNQPGILNLVTNNFWYKFTSVLIAVIIWSVVQGEEIVEINRRLPINVVVPEGYMIRGENVRVKDITLRFPRFIQTEISNRTLEATITIPKGKIGEHRFRIDKEYIKNWDARVKLTVHDPYVVVHVDESMAKEVPVREVLQGAPAEGFNIEKADIKPSTITVTGLKAEIQKLTEVITEVIDISGIRESKTVTAGIVTPGVSNREVSADKVEVQLKVGEGKVNRRFDGVPINIQGNEYLTSVRPKMVSVVIQASSKVLSGIESSDLEAFVELRGMVPGQYSKAVQIKIPPETVLVETSPSSVKIEVYNQKKVF